MKTSIKFWNLEYHNNGSLNGFYNVQFWLKEGKEKTFLVGTFETYDDDSNINKIRYDSARFINPHSLGDKLNGANLISLLIPLLNNMPEFNRITKAA